MTYALGIDVGTSYTAAATWRAGRAEIVPLGDRAHAVPSALFLRSDGVLLVGEAAARRGTLEPDRLARGFKRRLGDDAPLLLGDEELSAAELTGHLIRWVLDKVSEREGGRPGHVTLTCPATWGDYRRRLITEAAAGAQLTEVGLLAEPVAAAAYYAAQQRLADGALVAVYDLGGGTFDATVVAKTGTGFAIRGTPRGDETIGGDDFDQVVMDHVASTLRLPWTSLDTADPVVLAGLAQVRANAVEAKEALSADTDATIPVILPDLTRDVRITRGEFEAAIRIPILRTIDTLSQTLDGAGVRPADLHAVLLVGGSSRIPLVSRLLVGELGVDIAVDAHPKYAVCLGAAIAAAPRLAPAEYAAPPPSPAGYAGPRPSPAGYAGPPRGPQQPNPVGYGELPAGPRQPATTHPTDRPFAPPTPPPVGAVAPPTGAAPHVGAATPAAAPDNPASAAGVELLAPGPAPVVEVDPVAAGIPGPVDVTLRPIRNPGYRVRELTDQDQPLHITHSGDARRGRRTALLASTAAVVAVAAASALAVATRGGSDPPGPAPTTAGASQSAGTGGTGPAATLRAQPVPAVPGEVMHAITAGPSGTLLAVGESSTDGVPRAWRYAAGRWSALPGPTAGTTRQGGMNGVAVAAGRPGSAGARYVAVGWTAPRTDQRPTGADRQAAIWTADDGANWRLLPSPELGELTDVAARPGGGYLATGVDYGTDPDSGDGAVLGSPDGRRWDRLPATGLDGPGPTTLRRLLPGAGNTALAIGTRLDGGITRSGVWTSTDLRGWTEAATLAGTGPATASAWGLTRLADGTLLVVGATADLDGTPRPLLWTGRAPAALQPRPVRDAAGTLYATGGTAATVTAVGTQPSAAGPVAAAWTVTLR